MDNAYDVPDPTDWLNTPLQGLAQLETALHCQICKEFYDTPMITSCNHTFCSKCIRTSLSADGKCPACRTADQASKLRNNWALQEVVSSFQAARPSTIDVARRAQEHAEAAHRPTKRKRTTIESDDVLEGEGPGRTTRSKSRRIAASQSSQPELVEISDSDDQETQPEPEPADGLLECPLGCGKRMKEEHVFGHLDKCEEERKQSTKPKSRNPLNSLASSRLSPSTSARPQDRINELNYSMMKEGAFTKKLKEIGIPDWGSKQLMINRHKEWVNIWNANCDSTQPRTKRELLRDLDVWERTQGGRAPNVNGSSSNIIMRKDFDGEAYSKRHQDEFSRLIADAKRKKNNVATESEPAKNMKAEEEAVEPPITDATGDFNPYDHNLEAVSPVRSNVHALNNGQEIEPVVNERFEILRPNSLPAAELPDDSTTGNAEAKARNNINLSTSDERIIPAISQISSEQNTASKQPEESHSTKSRRSFNGDEHIIHDMTGSPCDIAAHLQLNSPRKGPMFAVPKQAIPDVDGGG